MLHAAQACFQQDRQMPGCDMETPGHACTCSRVHLQAQATVRSSTKQAVALALKVNDMHGNQLNDMQLSHTASHSMPPSILSRRMRGVMQAREQVSWVLNNLAHLSIIIQVSATVAEPCLQCRPTNSRWPKKCAWPTQPPPS